MTVDPRQLRRDTFERDHGVCAYCRCDTLEILDGYLSARAAARGDHARRLEHLKSHGAADGSAWTVQCTSSALKLSGDLKCIDSLLRWLGFIPGQHFWAPHHIVALAEGGSNSMENIATACTRCHRRLTAEQARRMARRAPKRVFVRGEDRRGRLVLR